MFTVKPNVELILDGNITLMGHSQNKGPIINVDGGKVWMRTGTNITGNENTGTTNILTTRSTGGGVYVGSGRFIMSGGTISGNTAEDGGGVFVANDRGIHEFEYVADDTSFCLYAGTISGNTADNGGGVYLYKASSMSYKNSIATITGNTARQRGGGLYVNRGRYEDWESMRKGSLIIAGVGRWNYASERYIKRGNDPYNGNAVKDEAGNIRGGYTGGHTMFWNSVSDGYPSLFSDETIGKWAKSNEQSDEQTEVSTTAAPASAPPAVAAPVAPAPTPPAAIAPKTPATAAPVQEQIVEQEQPVEQVQSREQVVVQQEQAASNIDPRLVGGSWWNGNKGGCTKWTFGDNGKGSVEYHCDVTPFGFTAVNGRITFFGKVQVCDEDGCEEVEMPGRNFSFLDDGKTLIIDRDRFTKGGPASCCPH
jgi:hypothetical protein